MSTLAISMSMMASCGAKQGDGRAEETEGKTGERREGRTEDGG